MVADTKCPDCRGGGDIIDDPKSGRKICTSCGLVLENQLISDQSEWRTFADNDRGGPDPNRVGQAAHYLLSDGGDLSTTIGDNSKLSNAQRAVGGNTAQSKLSRGIRDISNYCSRMSLPKDVQNFAGSLSHKIFYFFYFFCFSLNFCRFLLRESPPNILAPFVQVNCLRN